MPAIKARFTTRREAEMAIERLVQELGIERTSIFVEPEGVENSVGTEVAGSDAKRADPDLSRGDEAALNGRIIVSLDRSEADEAAICAAFGEFDGELI